MIGKDAEDFILNDQNGKPFSLKEHLNKKILLSFHPLAWTPVCSEQMKSLEENAEKFEEMDAIAVGISVDSTFCKHAWAKELGMEKIRLLSDFWPHGEVARKYGMFDEEAGFSKRANVVIVDGKIEFFKVYDISELPDINEVLEFMEEK